MEELSGREYQERVYQKFYHLDVNHENCWDPTSWSNCIPQKPGNKIDTEAGCHIFMIGGTCNISATKLNKPFSCSHTK